MTTLGFERDAPAAPAARFLRQLHDLAASIRSANRMAEDPIVLDRLGGLFARAESYRHHTLRTLSKLSRGESLGAEASMTKLLWSELGRDIYDFHLELKGELAEIVGDGPRGDWWHSRYWFARAATIYAGTSEIQRNIIAERVLGLPKG
jgi:alkylation response protein AidB-like acyl-CoA dehydrogenase